MKKGKRILAAVLLAALLLPVEARAVQTEGRSANVTEIPVYDMDILPGTWNPLSDMTAEKEFLLEMTSGSLYRVEAGTVIPAMAAAMPGDVTAEYAGSFGIPADAVRGYAFRVDLNEGACWEDGTPITAEDWLFTIGKYQESEKSYVNFATEEKLPANAEVISLAGTGFSSAAEALEAGYTGLYVNVTGLWGLEGGWRSVADRTRLRDHAIPSGLDEFYVTPAWLYETYLAEGRQYARWQGEMLGICIDTPERTTGCFKTGEYQLTLILEEPAAASALALRLARMRPLRESLWGPEYATSPAGYSACGPYRVETVEPGLITLVKNERWYGKTPPDAPALIRCRDLG